MTCTLCRSATLDRIVAPWVATITAFFAILFETILTIAHHVRDTWRESGAYCRKAGRQLMAVGSGLSRPMMSNLETIGGHATLLRHKTGFLPPSASVLPILVRKRPSEIERAVMRDVRGRSEVRIAVLFAEPSRRLLVPRDKSR